MGRGTWYRSYSKNTVEGYKRLDINWLHRNGYLRPGWSSTVSWSRNGEHTGSIGILAAESRIILDYQARSFGDWESVEQTVWLTWTPCSYGGKRPWFVCPGRGCGRRVGKLYGAGTYFLCRHCYDLVYESQRERLSFRLLTKAQNIRERLGGSASMIAPFPDKPKGMHWRTYMRLCAKYREADRLSLSELARGLGWQV